MFLGINMNRIKRTNMSAVLQALLRSGSISRVQLAEQTALSNTTITNLTAELIDQGLIAEEGGQNGSFEAERPVGRPRRMLCLIPDARFVAGVHIGIGVIRVALSNLTAELVVSKIIRFDPESPPENVLEIISSGIRTVIAESGMDHDRVIGIGVGVSGLVDHIAGINVFAPRLGWRNVPVKKILESNLGWTTCIDNNVRTMALGEAYFGAGQDVDMLAFVYGRIGVGAGFVLNGRAFWGSGAGAGEIGHNSLILADMGPHALNSPILTETLETLVSERAILTAAAAIAEKHPDSLLSAHLKDPSIAPTPIERVFLAARAGDELTRNEIEQRAQYLGISLANLTNTLNPELILLGGMFAQGADLILPVAEATLKKYAFAQLGEKVRVEPTSFGWRAGVVGASALALTNFVYQASVDLETPA